MMSTAIRLAILVHYKYGSRIELHVLELTDDICRLIGLIGFLVEDDDTALGLLVGGFESVGM